MRILIADDHDLLRDMLVMFLANEGGFETRTAASLEEACKLIEIETRFDLVLLDYNMPGMIGLAGLSRVIALPCGPRVALISGEATREVAEQALAAGAMGFIPKTLAAKSMVNAVRFMAMGERYAPPGFMAVVEAKPVNALSDRLSVRELQMLQGLTEGKSNKETARDLELQEPTVKLHMKTLYRKLGAVNRTQAALMARAAGLF